MQDWKIFSLGDICSFATDKISVSQLNKSNYISTENLLQNKGGVVPATSLPKILKTSAFNVGDVLISNIRPYFKKIFYANFSGGCSNDVLVFRANNFIDSKFLYYVLSEDKFFNYATATAKGTKMPRGDKNSIMKFEIKVPPLEVQKKIAAVLSALDDKIELNNKINKNLEQQAQAIFKNYFVTNFNSAWKSGKLGDIIEIKSGKRPENKIKIETDVYSVPIFGASSIIGFTNKIFSDKKILITGRVGTHGIIQRYNKACWISDNAFMITSKYYEYVFQILNNINYEHLNRGSTQPLITQTDLKKIDILIPDEKILLKFENLVGSLMSLYDKNNFENKKLAEMRDLLLPRLLNGEIDVSKVEG